MTEDNNAVPKVMPGFKEELKKAFNLAKTRFVAFLLIGIIGIAISSLIGLLWLKTSVMFLSSPSTFLLVLFPILGTALIAIPMILMFTAFFIAIVDENISPIDSYKQALPKFPGMIALAIISGLAIEGGFFLLLIPGIILSVWFYFAGYIYVKESPGIINSLVQSRECARGNFKIIFVRLLLIFLICAFCMLPMAALLLVPLLGPILFGLGAYLIAIVFFSYGYILYEDISATSDIAKVASLSKKQKAKSLSLALVSILVGLAVGAYSFQDKVSTFKKSPMNDMLKIAMSGDMSNPENQKAIQKSMENVMSKQLEMMANDPNMTPEMKEMLKQMNPKAFAEKPVEKIPTPQKNIEAKKVEKLQATPVEKLTEEEKKTNEEQIREIFTEVLNDSDWRIRRDAASALGQLGWEEYIPELRRLTHDKNREVKNAALLAIICIHSKNTK
ncbi:MAG: HEAT repeat domain-containing protein [Elusimicrobiales bacterium]|nr:HEAT repeat domain-containing protein [Elusimicrobiales bacterium]